MHRLIGTAYRLTLVVVGVLITVWTWFALHAEDIDWLIALWFIGVPLYILVESMWLFRDWDEPAAVRRLRYQQVIALMFWLVVLFFTLLRPGLSGY